MTIRGEPLKWLSANASFSGGECLPWPFSKYRNGYGQAWHLGKLLPAHRVMCILANGEPPFANAQAAHSCGARDCCNPRHLRWATQSENERDKHNHGTAQIGERNGAAKLTAAQVGLIKGLIARGFVSRVIGPFYGVDRKTIDAIKVGRTWGFVPEEADEYFTGLNYHSLDNFMESA